MNDFVVTINNKDQLLAALKQAPNIAKPTLNKGLQKAQAILAKHTVKGVVPWATGNLTQTFLPTFGDLMASWKPTAAYAAFVEFGHSQEPGRYVPAINARLVKGFVEGNPYMERIMALSVDEINTLFGQALDIITRDIAAAA